MLEKDFDKVVPRSKLLISTVKASTRFQGELTPLQNEAETLRQQMDKTQQAIEALDQNIQRLNLKPITKDDIQSMLQGTLVDANLGSLSISELYGRTDLDVTDIGKSPCDWFKLPEADARKFREGKASSGIEFWFEKQETTIEKCITTKCESPLILETQIQHGLEKIYKPFLGKLGLPEESRKAARELVEQTCNEMLKSTEQYKIDEMFYQHRVGGCHLFCKAFAEKIAPLISSSADEFKKYKDSQQAQQQAIFERRTTLEDEISICKSKIKEDDDEVKDLQSKIRDFIEKKEQEIEIQKEIKKNFKTKKKNTKLKVKK